MADKRLIDHIAFDIQKTLLMHGIQPGSDYVLRKISLALLEDEKISINWRTSGVKLVDPQTYIPIYLSEESKRIDNMASIVDDWAKLRSYESDKRLILEAAKQFLNREVDANGRIEIQIGEIKAFGFMLTEIYKKVCFKPEVHIE